MFEIFSSLQARTYKRNEIIIDELQEVHEFIFVEKGTYMVGY